MEKLNQGTWHFYQQRVAISIIGILKDKKNQRLIALQNQLSFLSSIVKQKESNTCLQDIKMEQFKFIRLHLKILVEQNIKLNIHSKSEDISMFLQVSCTQILLTLLYQEIKKKDSRFININKMLQNNLKQQEMESFHTVMFSSEIFINWKITKSFLLIILMKQQYMSSLQEAIS